ncbi:MAG TPA: twin-arginine translocase TatA/TatE family subunit, partial [Verrucomicrobiae bacterium]|nr:twin-arginine translocase TatA/TatE family subunit [Verrucomicrobiae bacterium]
MRHLFGSPTWLPAVDRKRLKKYRGGLEMSFTELFFIMVLGLILFGPEELPKIARTVGRMVFEIKKATQDVQSEMHKSIYEVKTSP